MPWQQLVADVAGEIDPVTGIFRRSIVVITVPRQVGKTTLDRGNATLRCLARPMTRAVYTAQTHKDARDRFLEGLELLSHGGARRLFTPRLSSGSERLVFANGSTDRLFAPLPDALHGSANDLARVDEGFAFDLLRGQELEQAVIPTFTTRRLIAPGPQFWIFSTAGTDESTWLRKWVELGRAACSDPSSPIAYFEWAAPEGSDPYDEALWPEVHPGLGHTATYQSLRDAAAVMSRDEFGRAFLNLWSRSSDRVIGAPEWAACLDLDAICPTRGAVLAVDVDYDRSSSAIGIAAPTATGTHVEVIGHRPGTSWLVDRVIELQRKWRAPIAGDPAGPAGPMVAELQARRARVLPVQGPAYASAAAAIYDAVVERRIVHIGQAELDDAVAAAVRRPMGDAWAWGRKASAAGISPLVAVTLAHHYAAQRGPRASVRTLAQTVASPL